MKNLTIILSTTPFTYVLPVGMNGEEWKLFKMNYNYFLEKFILDAKAEKKASITIDIDKLPVLVDDLKRLKDYMYASTIGKDETGISAWNLSREYAKKLFTFPSICELDASGFIKKCIK